MARRTALRRPSSLGTAGVAASLAVVLAGCGASGPHVRDYDIKDADKTACASLITSLPATVSGRARVDVDEPYAAAWGDPAIILRCGVGKPEGFDKFSACQHTEGVDWFVPESVMSDQRADVLMTTVGRSPRIDVLVPARYRPTAGPMVDLAAAIKATTKQTDPCR